MQIAKHRKAKKVQEALGPNFTVLEFDQPTASALQAATAIGCAVAQIAKSLVFADATGPRFWLSPPAQIASTKPRWGRF